MSYFLHKFDTPFGSMIAIGDEKTLYLLAFAERCNIEKTIKSFSPFKTGQTKPIIQIEEEISFYFKNKDHKFKTPFQIKGSPFETQVWEALQKIPPGSTSSYATLAQAIGKPKAARAVGNALKMNPFAILIPCHRVICSNGDLGGYNGGIDKKQGLLRHEQ